MRKKNLLVWWSESCSRTLTERCCLRCQQKNWTFCFHSKSVFGKNNQHCKKKQSLHTVVKRQHDAFHVRAPLMAPLLALVSLSPALLYLLHCINLGCGQQTLITPPPPPLELLDMKVLFGSEDKTGAG